MYITYDKGIPAKIGLTKISRRTKILVYGKNLTNTRQLLQPIYDYNWPFLAMQGLHVQCPTICQSVIPQGNLSASKYHLWYWTMCFQRESFLFVLRTCPWHFGVGKQTCPQSMQELFNSVILIPLDFHANHQQNNNFLLNTFHHSKDYLVQHMFSFLLYIANRQWAGRPVSCIVFQRRINHRLNSFFSYYHQGNLITITWHLSC